MSRTGTCSVPLQVHSDASCLTYRTRILRPTIDLMPLRLLMPSKFIPQHRDNIVNSDRFCNKKLRLFMYTLVCVSADRTPAKKKNPCQLYRRNDKQITGEIAPLVTNLFFTLAAKDVRPT